MKLKKTSTALAAVLIGAAVFTTSALADVVVGSGYNSLKNAVKTTTRELAGNVDNFTAKVDMTLRLDGQPLEQVSDVTKIDNQNRARETENTYARGGDTQEEYYSYSDDTQHISKSSGDDTYYVTKRSAPQGSSDDGQMIVDPFDSEMAKDAEKILDAFVGGLKDIVQVEESEGKKQYIGNLTETQVPPVVNAVSSFMMKYGVLESYDLQELGLPAITSDIYVKEASGKAIENESGILESAIGTASVVGNDAAGVEHTITLELALEISDVNATVVEAPNLEGEKVEVFEEGQSGYVFDDRYVGVYKNDIIKVESDQFIKIGERVLEITSVADGKIEGRYYEDYAEGYAPKQVRDFTFTGVDELGKNTILTYTDNTDGTVKHGVLHRSGRYGQDLTLELNVEISDDSYMSTYDEDYNGEFIRQF